MMSLLLTSPCKYKRTWTAWHSSNRKNKPNIGTRENLTKLALIISDFVTPRTKDAFPALGINDTFVQNPATTWESDSNFSAGLTKVHVLAKVNDSAARAIAFIEKFNTAITTMEEHAQ